MKKQIILLAMMLVSLASIAQERPKLVVGIAVDQMRWDYLYRYYNEYGLGGFRRLMNEGFNCENCQINYIPSITAIGHTSVFTGSVPSIHGIAGNSFLINGKSAYCAGDSTVQTVGSDTKAGKMSPRNLLVTTIGDELKTATNWRSKVIGVSFKDRAAILPAGHSADAAYWFDKKALCFITSTYYMQQLPAWVAKYNKTIKQIPIDEIQYTPYGNEITVGMAKAAVENEKLYVNLDKQLADFFSFLDQKIGKGQYLVFLTADHGASNGILQNQAHKIPSDGFFSGKEEKSLNSYLCKAFNTSENLVKRFMNNQIVLNKEAIARIGAEDCKVRQSIIKYFSNHPKVQYCVDMENVLNSSVPSLIREKIINGYNHKRSGDMQIIMNPAHYGVGDVIDAGTTHSAWNPYDCHIPFVLMGWGVSHGSTQAECHITDIAPTICSLIHIQAPNGCIGNPVVQVTK